MTVSEACEANLFDIEARNLRKSTLEAYQSLFRLLTAVARDAGLGSVASINAPPCAHGASNRRVVSVRSVCAPGG